MMENREDNNILGEIKPEDQATLFQKLIMYIDGPLHICIIECNLNTTELIKQKIGILTVCDSAINVENQTSVHQIQA